MQVQLKAGVKFQLGNEVFTILKRLPGLKVQAEEERFGKTIIFKDEELIKYLCNGDLRFECKGKNLKIDNKALINTSYSFEDLDDSSYKERMIFRYQVIYPILKTSPKERHNAILKRVEEVNSWSNNPKLAKENLNGCFYYHVISEKSIYRWLKDYEKANGDIRALCPSYSRCGGKNIPRINPEIINFINESIEELYLNKQRFTIQILCDSVNYKIYDFNKFHIEKLNPIPFSTMARYIAKVPLFEAVKERFGLKPAKDKFGQVGGGIKVTYPLERVEIDHTPLDIMLVSENGTCITTRPYLVLAIDVYTRMPIGFSIGISNGVGWPEVMLCIKHIISDKSYVKEKYPALINNDWPAFGIPRTIVTDNGPEFKNKDFEDACLQLGIDLLYCPPRTPEFKPHVERFFGITNTSLIHNMSGTTRSNPQELGDRENPAKLARLTFPVFVALIHKWIIDVYSQDLHSGMEKIPVLVWKKAIEDYPVPWPNNISQIVPMLGRTEYRKIVATGVELNCLFYNCNELTALLQKFNPENKGKETDFKVKYDPRNLGEVYVYDHLISKDWIKVPCTHYNYANGLSEWEHRDARAYAKKEFGIVDKEALVRAKMFLIQTWNVSPSKKDLAKSKKINSDKEISNNLVVQGIGMNENSVIAVKETEPPKLTLENISDLGLKINAQETIIPESLAWEEKAVNDPKVVPLHSKPKKKNTKQEEFKPEMIADSTENTLNDFSGFGLLSYNPGVNLNE